MKKGTFWIVIRLESLILRTCETQSFYGKWSVRSHFGSVRWSHTWVNLRSRNKITSQCADPVRDRVGDCNACERTYPFRKGIAIRNGFRDLIRSCVNRPSMSHAVSDLASCQVVVHAENFCCAMRASSICSAGATAMEQLLFEITKHWSILWRYPKAIIGNARSAYNLTKFDY